MKSYIIFLLSVLSLLWDYAEAVTAIHETMNFVLPPLQRQCFYEDFSANSPTQKIEVFVLSGGRLEVLLTLHGPLTKDEVLAETFEDPIMHASVDSTTELESETLTYQTEFKAEKAGTYAICLDNRKSRFISKTVQLDVRPYRQVEEKLDEMMRQDQKNAEVDLEKLKQSLGELYTIHRGLTDIQLQQHRDRHRLSLHSETNESNYKTVFAGSIFETAVFILVAAFQIYFVRRWFASRTPAKGAKSWA